MRLKLLLIAIALAWVGALMGRAEAQVISSPDDVRACLCLDQSTPALSSEVDVQRRAYEEKRQSLETLNKQVEDGRSQVNVNNPADVEAFKRLLERRDDEAADFSALTSGYADNVRRYDQAVTEYNNKCAGKTFDPRTFGPQQIQEIKRTLSCPKR